MSSGGTLFFLKGIMFFLGMVGMRVMSTYIPFFLHISYGRRLDFVHMGFLVGDVRSMGRLINILPRKGGTHHYSKSEYY